MHWWLEQSDMVAYLEVLHQVVEDTQSLGICALVDVCERANFGGLHVSEMQVHRISEWAVGWACRDMRRRQVATTRGGAGHNAAPAHATNATGSASSHWPASILLALDSTARQNNQPSHPALEESRPFDSPSPRHGLPRRLTTLPGATPPSPKLFQRHPPRRRCAPCLSGPQAPVARQRSSSAMRNRLLCRSAASSFMELSKTHFVISLSRTIRFSSSATAGPT